MAVHRVVVVGGGFGGVRLVKSLRRAPVEITLIDRTNHHLFQPLLYQVATGVLSPGQIAPALRGLFRGQGNVRVVLAEVDGLDLERRVVHASGVDALEIPYDTLVVAAGATHSYFGHDEWAEHAPGMKTLDDATRLRSRILGAFELADQAETPEARAAWLSFAVVGAGPTGVEIAGQIAVLAHRVLRGEYDNIDSRDARVMLVDTLPAVLPAFHPKLQQRAERDLRDLGVELRLATRAAGVDRDGIEVEGSGGLSRIDAKTVIWAAGVRASPLARLLADASGAAIDRQGRVAVAPDLALPGHPEVFAIGDLAALPGVPGVAPAAIQEGAYVGGVVKARVAGRRAPGPFHYTDKGSLATIGRTRAVADIRGLRLAGFPAFLIWGLVHLAYLVGWSNRFGAVLRWMWTLVARNRRERLVSVSDLEQQRQEQRA